ncbi:MAG TPA: hypothetical protein VEH58_07015 [Dehalococcoidales bacterium]|nr:hypothetical protein [Dehalococcoidales bacterium]
MAKNDSTSGSNGNNGNGQLEESLTIGERSFTKTRLGLDETEVREYIEELIEQCDTLKKKEDRINALKELAENTVIEANAISQKIKDQAANKAKAEAEKILSKAEQDSSNIKDQAVNKAKVEAEKILSKAEQESSSIKDQAINKAKVEAEKILSKAEQDSSYFIESTKAEAKVSAQKEADEIRSQAYDQVKVLRAEQLDKIKSEAATLAQTLQKGLLDYLDNMRSQVQSLSNTFEAIKIDDVVTFPLPKVDKKPVNVPKPKTDHALTEDEKGNLLDAIPWLEVEVLPPLDIEKIMELISRLEALPEVKTTDLLPETPNPLIRVFLTESSPLGDLLRTLPQVQEVREIEDSTGDAKNPEKRQRIQIVLGKNQRTNIKGEKTAQK